MAEQQMANYTLTIEADSGYESTTEGRCTAEQYGRAMAALHGTIPAAQRPWVGLTDEKFRYFASTPDYGTGGLIRAIEAELKGSNT